MNARELARWREANTALDGAVDRAGSLCQDCTPAFADEMRFEQRCDGWPGSSGRRFGARA